MSVNYWIGAKCPWCHGRNGEHTDDCKFINNTVLDRKPLRWRTGEIPNSELDKMFLVQSALKDGYYLSLGWDQRFAERWLPLSEILALVEG